MDRFTYYGYKFESVATGAPSGEPVDSTREFAVMVQVRLGGHQVLMAAETDAWETPLEEAEEQQQQQEEEVEYIGYTEIKTFVLPQGDRALERLYRDKYPRWWLQSFLAGVPTLLLGGRDRGGTVRQVGWVVVRWRAGGRQSPSGLTLSFILPLLTLRTLSSNNTNNRQVSFRRALLTDRIPSLPHQALSSI
ncbi:hypothetical protein Agub_g12559 [Astrephomene gubernaculifera]|uniref:Decapping nuclease n=1 Tax=Astrephomene gubernaculifera TaxID=47775 RepID=A0AAD3DYE2_9CHLO|nr:hypothetical protein Agub_g12559 [Astrephomene gubernaculifera]